MYIMYLYVHRYKRWEVKQIIPLFSYCDYKGVFVCLLVYAFATVDKLFRDITLLLTIFNPSSGGLFSQRFHDRGVNLTPPPL